MINFDFRYSGYCFIQMKEILFQAQIRFVIHVQISHTVKTLMYNN